MTLGRLFATNSSFSLCQCRRKHDERYVRRDAQCCQYHYRIPTGAELVAMQAILSHLGKELAVALLATEETDAEHSSPVDGEERSDAVEFRGENLENDQGERELGQCGADICSLEGPLSSAHFDDLVRGQDRGAGAVHA